ncbi:DUF4267 domain-containing protein [Nocardia tengchongensis]|uniref:DUF4267 domain-containing protein n=1 Tax=Nocardia tengchongensis TaxID=2055889 RepID=UPI0036CFA438
MNTHRITTALTLIAAAFILIIGMRYLSCSGVETTSLAVSHDDATAFTGVRDITVGTLLLTLLGTGQRYPLGMSMVVVALTPIGDMFTLLAHNGSTAIAFGVHGPTAMLFGLTGSLLLHEQQVAAADSTDSSISHVAV